MAMGRKLGYWEKYLILLMLLPVYVACGSYTSAPAVPTAPSRTPSAKGAKGRSPESKAGLMSPANNVKSQPPRKENGNIGIVADEAQLVDIRSVNPTILLDIRYATENNFMKRKVYPVARCVLRATVAEKLSRVQADLAQKGLGLKVYDCYRPLSVQKLMWAVFPDERYVANPANGSRHNRGSAIDVTLVDQNGKELEMPTEFDDFTERADRDYSGASSVALKNRQLLEDVMVKYGFIPLQTEWWHFDAEDWKRFPITDVPLESIP